MKKSTLFHTLILLSYLFLFSRCGVTLYVPNTVNSPLFGEKGDFKLNAGLVTQAPEPTFDFQGAYAVSDHVAVMGNTSFMSGNEANDNNQPNTHILLEAAGGLFTAFGPDNMGWNLGRAEIFGGYGFGWAEDYDNGNTYKGNYQRAFIQPAIGLRQKVVDFSFSPRLSFINFGTYEGTPFPTSKSTLNFTTFEPTATVSLGYKRGKVYLQFSRVLLMSGREDYELVTLFEGDNELNFNIGGTFSTWKQKEIEKPPVSLERPERPKNEPADLERDGKAEPAPTSVTVSTSDFTICVKEGGSPDGDIVSLSFNGVYLAKELELAKKPECFDVAIAPGQEGVLRIQTISGGVFTPNTIQILVRQDGKEKLFYLRTEEGQTDEIKFKQND